MNIQERTMIQSSIKNLYAIPEQYIDIIENIDPNMTKYVEKFKEESKVKQQDSFELSVSADNVKSTDKEFTMNNLSLGDNFTPIEAYFQTANGATIVRNLNKREKKISNQTMPRIAFQIFEKQIANLSIEDKENFPICRYSSNSDLICGIYSSVEEFRKHRKTIEYMQYKYDNNKLFVIYCWNIFSTIIFVQECLKRFGNYDDKFVLRYTKKDKNEIESKKIEPIKQEDYTMKNTARNLILYGPPGTGKTYNTVLKAMSIIDNTEYKDVTEERYSVLKTRFDELKQAGQIEFVTFHQSYSYEEFVEGIKPNLEKDGLNYYKPDGIFKKICKNASKNLYKLNNNQKMQQVSFDEVMDSFKEKHPEGSDFENLLNISYEENNLIYHFGMQEQDRKIDLLKMEQLFNLNKQYRTSIDFNNEYGGNVSLKGYYHTFYKELLNIKNALEDENQVAIENNKEYIVDENAPKYVLIIDEINRGNISKIFGELITLIEPDKRKGSQYELKVSYHILQMMNCLGSQKIYIS